jgi:hypothetical protein
MLARLLFATVWLTIAAGVLLPLVPLGEEMPTLAGADDLWTASDVAGLACEDCAPAAAGRDGCGAFCPCHHLHAAPATVRTVCLSLTVHLVVQPLPAGRSREPLALPPKLPAI